MLIVDSRVLSTIIFYLEMTTDNQVHGLIEWQIHTTIDRTLSYFKIGRKSEPPLYLKLYLNIFSIVRKA